ncbi:MAG TPA: NADP oxidoreductase, partial [Solirubrobacterales bacterium]
LRQSPDGSGRGAAEQDEGTHVEVDMFDRLPTPFGLVRAGVAPDHPKIKSVIRVYEKTAARDGFRFFGNVEIGSDLTVEELAARYHATIHAHGSARDRALGIPGEELPGSHAATEFVAWYNAHPDFADRSFDLSVERAVVIGNGNVAADVARMLALTRAELEATDTAQHAIDALAESGIREIVVLGRRGPAQAAFTNPELRELGEMEAADVFVDPAEVELDELSRAWLESDRAEPTNRRNVEILEGFAAREPTGKPRRITLRFCASPVEIRGDGRVESMVIGRNRLEQGADGRLRAVYTGEREVIECGLVLRSIGYRGVGLEGLPFDEEAGIIPNEHGRVRDASGVGWLPGQYVVGWIKRGPSGVIGTNKKDAQDTVTAVLEDLGAGRLREPAADGIESLVAERCRDCVTFGDWQAIDRAEVERGEPLGRPRVKFCSVEEMLEAARAAAVAAGDRG